MDPAGIVILFLASVGGGAFGTLTGGGSLVTIPALIFAGLPSTVAVASNRLGITGLNVAGWYKFHEKGVIDYRVGFTVAVPALVGAVVGAESVLLVSEVLLRRIIAVVTLAALGLVFVNPEAGLERRAPRTGSRAFALGAFLSFVCGVYGGFYGAGTGTLLSYVLVLLFGQTFIESAGTRKIAVTMLSVVAAVIFVFNGVIDYRAAFVVFVGTFLGSWIGAHYADAVGNVWIKRIFTLVVVVMALKLLI